jgi:hypothetical protein
MSRSSRPPANYKASDVFDTAMRFHTACNFLNRVDYEKEGPVAAALGAPTLALSALTVELLLKTLHAMEGRHVPATHNLGDLFRNLDPKTRQEIEKGWAVVVRRRDAMWKRIEAASSRTLERGLAGALKEGSQAFERFRYSFEFTADGGMPDYYVDDLRYFLVKLIVYREPTWGKWNPGSPAELVDTSPLPSEEP